MSSSKSCCISQYTKHPLYEGVYVRRLVTEEMNPKVATTEAIILAGFAIPPHAHVSSSEVFYIVDGCGEVLLGGDKYWVHPGDFCECIAERRAWLKKYGERGVACILLLCSSPRSDLKSIIYIFFC